MNLIEGLSRMRIVFIGPPVLGKGRNASDGSVP